MATIAKLVADLSLNDQLSAGLKKTAKSVDKFGESARKVGKKVALGVTLPTLAGFGKMVMAASDLNEAASATETIYGKSAKAILSWSKTTADGYGISQSAALGAANTFGQVFKGVGITTEAASGLSTQLIESAGDLASFYDKVPTDVLQDLQSGIVGQYEPLLKYGIVLNEATVSQKAMTMTGKTNVKMLTDAEKIAARTALITEGLGAAQGDAARTSNSLANMLRRLRARGADLAARWGQLLLPRMQKFVGFLLNLTTRIENLSPKMQKFALIGLAIAAAIGPAIYVVGVLASVLALLLSPIGLLVVGVGALAALFGGDLIRSFDSIIGYVKTFITVMGLAYGNTYAVKDLIEFLPEPLQRFERGLLLIANAAGHLVRAFEHHGIAGVFEVLPRELDNVWTAIKQLVGGMASLALDFVIDTAVSIGGWLWEHKGDIWGGIKALIGWTTDTFTDAISATISGAITLAGDLWDAAGNLWGWVKSKLLGTASAQGATSGAVATGAMPSISLGTVLLDGTLQLARAIYGGASDLVGWFKLQLFGESGSGFTVKDITATLAIALKLAANTDFSGIATTIKDSVVSAIGDLADLGSEIAGAVSDKIGGIDNWVDYITSDSFDLGEAVGIAIRGAIGTAARVTAGLVGGVIDAIANMHITSADVIAVGTKVAEGIAKVFLLGPAIFVSLTTAFATFMAGLVKGLVFGEDADFNSVVKKIASGVMTALSTAGDSITAIWSNFTYWLEQNISADTFTKLGKTIADAVWAAIKTAAKDVFNIDELVDLFKGGGSGSEPGGGTNPGFEFTSNLPNLTELGDKLGTFADKVKTHLANVKTDTSTNMTAAASALIAQTARMQAEGTRNVQRFADQSTVTFQRWGDTTRSAVTSTMTTIVSEITNRMGQAQQQAAARADGLRSAVTRSLETMRGQVPGIMAGFSSAVTSPLTSLRAVAGNLGRGIGNDIASGINAGMAVWTSTIAATAANLVTSAIVAARLAADAHSDSREMIALGKDMVSGLLRPLREGKQEVAAALGGLISIPAAGSVSAASGSAGQATYNTFAPGSVVLRIEGGGDSEEIARATFALFSREFGLHQGGN